MRLQSNCGDEVDDGFYEAQAGATSGADFSYKFGVIAEESTPPGHYKLCWCQASFQSVPLVTCSQAEDFLTFVADVTVICPQGHAAC